MSGDGPQLVVEHSTPDSKRKPPSLNEDDLEEEEEDDWENMDSFQLAKTPVKVPPMSPTPSSPHSMKVYDSSFLLQFRTECPSRHVKTFFPEHYEAIERKKAEARAEQEAAARAKEAKEAARREEASLRYGRGRGQPGSGMGQQLFQQRRVGFGQYNNSPLGAAFGGPQQEGNQRRQQQHPHAKLEHRCDKPFKKVAPTDATQKTAKAVQGILNKITPEKYDNLVDKICKEIFVFNVYDPNDETAMNVLDNMIGMTFEKALAEPQWSNMYADVCKHLCDVASAASQNSEPTSGGDSQPVPLGLFRRLLIDRCQSEFEAGVEVDSDDKLRKRRVANMKFIGELFKRSLLTEKIMHDVIQRLLLGGGAEDHMPTAEEIEVLCKLWMTVGKILDRPQAQRYIEYYFTQMTRLSKTFPESRLRFMLLDVIELRGNKWVPRREKDEAKKISEIEEGFARKQSGRDLGGRRNSRSPPNPYVSIPVKNLDPLRGRGGSSGGPSTPVTSTGSGYRNRSPTPPPQSPTTAPLPVHHQTHHNSRGGGQKKWKQKGQVEGRSPSPPAPRAPVSPPQPTPSTATTAPTLSVEAMDTKAQWLIGEFLQSSDADEFMGCMSDMGKVNHSLFFGRAIYRVIEQAKLQDERWAVGGLARVHCCGREDQKNVTKDTSAFCEGFRLALVDVVEFESWADSPHLWRNLSELLLEVVNYEVVGLDVLNDAFMNDFWEFNTEEAQRFIVSLFEVLQQRDAVWMSCSGFFNILDLLPAKAVPELLNTLQQKGLLEVDCTLWTFQQLQLETMQPQEILAALQEKLGEETLSACYEVVCNKIARGVMENIAVHAEQMLLKKATQDEVSQAIKAKVQQNKALLAPEGLGGAATSSSTPSPVDLQVGCLTEATSAFSSHQLSEGFFVGCLTELKAANICGAPAMKAWTKSKQSQSKLFAAGCSFVGANC
eukprot:TRINITY_DN27541_c0_g1_i1.p1 TRINITY_DN27541_c0_g1~~TRINITY_DN27541_c0_g1_i1.p1  ORF type:complete len:951 (-),score=99.33 TRINITY_DN27541_c0_g1_i1:80-2908(-)